MADIQLIEESEGIEVYLRKRALTKQYQKAKMNILAGRIHQVTLKKRKPVSSGLYYFRINKKYRAIGFMEGSTLVVTTVDDHQ
jgi:hypothetical protein